MKEYHKIQTVWARDPNTKFKTLIEGEWALPEFGYLADCEWTFTEKVDGTNVRVMRHPGHAPTFGGKTDNAQMPAKLVARLEERFHAPEALEFFKTFDDGGDVCLYGEGYGAGIQKGGVYRPDQDFVLFDVWVNGWWLQREDVEDIASKLGLDVVPIIHKDNLHTMIKLIRGGLNKSRWGDFQAEGLVARPTTELCDRAGRRIITKLKMRDFA